MAIRYEISTWHGYAPQKAFAYAKRQRLDAALDELWRQIFEMVSGNAGRDTKRGWELKHEFDAYAAKLEKEGLKPGHYRHDKFYWREGDNAEYVEFWQQRI